jgi:hypothetical protein
MKKHFRDALLSLEKSGIEVERTEFTRGGHVKFRVRRPDGSVQSLIHGASPSDHRATRNLVALARRVIRLPRAA